jgi:hypothetical protein
VGGKEIARDLKGVLDVGNSAATVRNKDELAVPPSTHLWR